MTFEILSLKFPRPLLIDHDGHLRRSSRLAAAVDELAIVMHDDP
jgi:hypothetical protein